MNTRPGRESFDALRAEAFIHRENTMAIVCDRPFDEVAIRLESCIASSAFSLVHVHDIEQMLRSSGAELKHRSRVYEVCSPAFFAQLLALESRAMSRPARSRNRGRLSPCPTQGFRWRRIRCNLASHLNSAVRFTLSP